MQYVVTYHAMPDDARKTMRVVADNADAAKARVFEADGNAYSVDDVVLDESFYDTHGMVEKDTQSANKSRVYSELRSISNKLTALIEIQKELVKYLAGSDGEC